MEPTPIRRNKKWKRAIALAIILGVIAALLSQPAVRFVLHEQIWSLAGKGEWGLEYRYEYAYRLYADENRSLSRAAEVLEESLLSHEHQESMYLLARTYFGLNKSHKVIDVANEYLDLYPAEQRMHYLRGLAYGYTSNWDKAESDFLVFITYAPTEWAGYLDLSWIYFQSGRMSDARKIIEKGYQVAPDNPWIQAAFGVVLLNQNQREEAIYMLESALESAEELSFGQWQAAYSATAPDLAREEFDQFKDVITYNLQLAKDNNQIDVNLFQSVYETRFADPSVRGIEYGLHVSACNSSCPACNVCGDCATEEPHGTSCAPPSLPNGYGEQCVSSTNICAQNNEGTVDCDGCSANIPEAPVPNPNGYTYVPSGSQTYIYEADTFSGSSVAQVCYSFANNSGRGVFVPMRSVAEFENFVSSDVITSDPNLELLEMDPTAGDDSVLYNNTVYTLYDVSATRSAALADCQTRGGDLASIASSAENAAVAGLYGGTNFWIGGTDVTVENTWVWSDGSTWSYTNWASGEPNNSGDQDCSQVYATGEWDDVQCTNSMAYVCEFPL